eukprot:295293_1
MDNMCWSVLINIYLIGCHTQNIRIFEQSLFNPDEYCRLLENPIQCDDIQYILHNECTESNECKFILNNGTFIQKQYNISTTISPTTITFLSVINEPITIYLEQSFLYISAYTGTINIENIHFTSAFLEVSNENTQFIMNINQCHFYNINNSSIITIPSQMNMTEFSKINTITFNDSNIYRNIVPQNGLFSIKRNNVLVEFSRVSIHDNTALNNDIKGILNWKCQQKINDNDDMCG